MAAPAPIALKARAVIRRPAPLASADDEVLLSFAIDPDTGARYGRFLGGSIEFGEHAEATLRREIREEIGVDLGPVVQLGTVEDVCRWDGRLHHEVTFVFEALFADAACYRRERFIVAESVCDGPAVWVPLAQLATGVIPVYPPALRNLLQQVLRSPRFQA
jgi:8-oxo-dGTP pyrophosphatase MutT (NUDIX family)